MIKLAGCLQEKSIEKRSIGTKKKKCIQHNVVQLDTCRTPDNRCVLEYSWETESLSLLPGCGRGNWLTPGRLRGSS